MSVSPNIYDSGDFSSACFGAKEAHKIGTALAEIERKRGDLTPELVVKAAQSKRSPLHSKFLWDDTAAAHSYRLVQAAWLIRTVKVRVVVNDKPAETRAFIRVVRMTETARNESGGGSPAPRSYVPLASALENPDWREQMLSQALRELESFQRKYATLEELADIMSAIEKKLKCA